MSGFSNATDGDFDRVFTTTSEIISRFVGSKVWTWGKDNYGQLGDNTVVNKSTPIQTVAGGTNWKQLACGYTHAAAIKTDGTLWLWGWGVYGQLGDNTTTSKSSPVQTISGGLNWSQVACGYYHTAAIKTDGTLWVWGDNTFGGLGTNNTTRLSSPVQTITGGTNWKQVVCGKYTTTAIKTDGTLWSCGYNDRGQLGDGTLVNRSSPVQVYGAGINWSSLASTSYTTAAIKTDGTLWSWGYNGNGELGDNSTTNRSSPVQTIAGGTNWKSIQRGTYHTAAIKTDGTLWMWGNNQFGQLGNNTTTTISSPVQTVTGGTNWMRVSCGGYTTAAIKTDGTLWSWGRNESGQLGDNTIVNKSSPVQNTAGGINWKQLSCGVNGYTSAIGE